MTDSAYVLGCLVFCGGAAEALLVARIIPECAILALIFLGAAIYLTITSKNPLTCLLILSATTTLILSLRFSSLTWGDPWQDYESVLEILVQGYQPHWADTGFSNRCCRC
ncbi:MAG TPA: hypothetical protein VN429_06025 [Methanospirillum sp.]|uniref:hypothetical protein n=1 Tax=Methanospirillum sp. TaxID=45200 RepID=UPI002B99D553|nr:hypothetical protein [Methanospirillum sp.]HWQ63955.1 hypothetical protein [Methanospirillum sp.]